MAYVYSDDRKLGEQMCRDKKHHWHMTTAKAVTCCRCDLRQNYRNQESEGPHDDRGDRKG